MGSVSVRPRELLAILLISQIFLDLAVIFNVTVARQAIGFVYSTFLLGFIIVKLLGLDQNGKLATLLFSVGFSVAFLMLFGLLMNSALFTLGISKPLSLEFMLFGLNAFSIIGAFLIFKQNKGLDFHYEASSLSQKWVLFLYILPILGITGAVSVDAYGNNLIQLVLIVGISAVIPVIIFSKKLFSPKSFPLVLLTIGISILFSASFISSHLVPFGSDSLLEYFIFKMTQTNLHWISSPPITASELYGRLNGMLSITILPTVYSTLLNMDPVWVFKVLFPAIFSFVPLCLYKLWESNLGKKAAFIAAFLLIAQNTFYSELLGLNRQIIAELFFVLLLIVLFSKKIKSFGKTMCFIVFSVGLVTSHYGIAEIFLIFLTIVTVYLFLTGQNSKNMTVSFLILFSTIMFGWYIYTSSASVFESFAYFGSDILRQLNQFLNPTSRGSAVLLGLGLAASPTMWNSIGRIFAYLTEILIALGAIELVMKRRRSIFSREQTIVILTSVTLLAALVFVPGLANSMGMARFYHILLFLLAPLFILGVQPIVALVSKKTHMRNYIGMVLLTIVVVPYFLFQSGFIYAVTGSPNYSLPLSRNSVDPISLRARFGYFSEQEKAGALWVSEVMNSQNTIIYADSTSMHGILQAYIYYGNLIFISNDTFVWMLDKTGARYISRVYPNSLVYLNDAVLSEETAAEFIYGWNITVISSALSSSNSIYSNGGCEVDE